jgi:DNA-binding XRE family transcriptional regulator
MAIHFAVDLASESCDGAQVYGDRAVDRPKIAAVLQYCGITSSEVNRKMKLVREHVVAARAILRLTQAELAEAAGVAERTIARFELGEPPALKEDSLWRIQTALEDRGIEFFNSDRPGVRFNPDKVIVHKGQ